MGKSLKLAFLACGGLLSVVDRFDPAYFDVDISPWNAHSRCTQSSWEGKSNKSNGRGEVFEILDLVCILFFLDLQMLCFWRLCWVPGTAAKTAISQEGDGEASWWIKEG